MPERDTLIDTRGGKFIIVELENTRTGLVKKINTYHGNVQTHEDVVVERIPSSNGQSDLARIYHLSNRGEVINVEIRPLSEVAIKAVPKSN